MDKEEQIWATRGKKTRANEKAKKRLSDPRKKNGNRKEKRNKCNVN
jgi:hypothetical protein